MEKEEKKGFYKNLRKGILAGTLTLATLLPIKANATLYQSPVISSQEGYSITRHFGEVKESEYPRVQEGKLYFVQYGSPFSSEADARDENMTEAIGTVENISKKKGPVLVSQLKAEQHEVYEVSKKGEKGYIVNTVFSVPLAKFSKDVQKEIFEKYGAKEEKAKEEDEGRSMFVYNETTRIERDRKTEEVGEKINKDVTNYKNLRSIIQKHGKFLREEENTKYLSVKDASFVVQEGNKYLVARLSVNGKSYDLIDSNEDGVVDEIEAEGKYRKINLSDKTEREVLKKYFDVVDPLVNKTPEKKGLETLIKGFMIISGVGALYSMYSSRAVGEASGEFLAPPISVFWPYAFGAVLLAGVVYFIAKAIIRERREISPSF
jgi:hypothetical protein